MHREGPAIGDTSEAGRGGRWNRIAGPLACAAALLACEVLVFRYLFQYGVSNVWRFDGVSQHFAALHYYRETVLAWLRGPLGGVELWSWRLGFGADVPTTLSYYFGDPFAALSLLFPAGWLEYVYEGAFFLRLVVAGLAAYAYLRRMEASAYGAIVGCVLYVFTTFTMFSALRHPYFANAMVLFPLMLLGIESALRERRWVLLVFVTAVAAAGNFYFFYQMSIIAVIYGVARLIELRPSGSRLRALLPEGFRVAGYVVLGVALAAVVLVPVALAVLASSRVAEAQPVGVFAAARVYGEYLVALATPVPATNSMYAGFSILSFLLAPVLFTRRGHGALKTMLIAFPVFLVSPLFGSLFNGLEAPSYRFLFMWGLFLAAAVATLLSEPRPFGRRDLTVMAAALALYAAAASLAAFLIGGPYLISVVVMAGLGLLMWGAFAFGSGAVPGGERVPAESRGVVAPDRTSRRLTITRVLVAGLVVAGIAGAGLGSYSKRFGSTLDGYMPLGATLESYEASPGSVAASLPGVGPGRVEVQDGATGSGMGAVGSNEPLVQGYPGTSFYYSIMNGGVFDHLKGLDLRTIRLGFDFNRLDDRAALETLSGVRYYIATREGAHYVPYGFEPTSTVGASTVYENANALPLGYVYHAAFSETEYAAMPPLEKQQALLRGVVVPRGAEAGLSRADPGVEVVEVPVSVTATRGATYDAGSRTVRALKHRTGLELRFASPRDCELYVDLTGVEFDLGDDEQLFVSAGSVGPAKTERLLPRASAYYWADRSVLINLGYFRDGASSAYLRFDQPGTVRFAGLKVYAVPMASYASRVATLAGEGMRDVRVGRDAVAGTVTSRGPGLLFLSIPFSDGWTATVDGAAVTPVRANVGFIGLPVADGMHRIELRYTTPGLRAGAIVSAVALLIVLGLWAWGPAGGPRRRFFARLPLRRDP